MVNDTIRSTIVVKNFLDSVVATFENDFIIKLKLLLESCYCSSFSSPNVPDSVDRAFTKRVSKSF